MTPPKTPRQSFPSKLQSELEPIPSEGQLYAEHQELVDLRKQFNELQDQLIILGKANEEMTVTNADESKRLEIVIDGLKQQISDLESELEQANIREQLSAQQHLDLQAKMDKALELAADYNQSELGKAKQQQIELENKVVETQKELEKSAKYSMNLLGQLELLDEKLNSSTSGQVLTKYMLNFSIIKLKFILFHSEMNISLLIPSNIVYFNRMRRLL